ncbi:hypothetical protein LXL04_039707 [Taraxacum kok-saghyz]
MILMDEEGDVIQATLSKNLFYKFQTQLREGSDYLIASPTLGEQNINFLPRQQKNKITFLKTTILINSPNFTTTSNGFSFVDFPLILADDFPLNQSIDVIGALMRKPELDTTKQRHLLPIKLQDLQLELHYLLQIQLIFFIYIDLYFSSGNIIEVSLWKDLAHQLNDFITLNQDHSHVIIALQFGKKHLYNGLGKQSVTSWWDHSKLFVNKDWPEINKFKESYLARYASEESSTAVSELSSPSVSNNDDFWTKHPIKYINEVLDPIQIQKFIIVGKFVSIRQDQEWYYLSCTACPSKVIEKWLTKDLPDGSKSDPSMVFECKNRRCQKLNKNPIPRSHLHPYYTQMEDISILFCNTYFNKLIPTSLKFLCTYTFLCFIQLEFNLALFPDELNVLKNLHLAFKVVSGQYNVTNQNTQYSISKVSNDTELIKELTQKLNMQSQGTESFSHVPCHSDSIQNINSKDDISQSMGENITPSSVTKSASYLNDMPSTSSTMKRNLDEVIDVDDTTQSSTTKPRRLDGVDGVGIKLLIPKVEK